MDSFDIDLCRLLAPGCFDRRFNADSHRNSAPREAEPYVSPPVLTQSSTRRSLLKFACWVFLFLVSCNVGSISTAEAVEDGLVQTAALVERLRETNLLNGSEIYEQLKLVGTNTSSESNPAIQSTSKFSTANPYKPRHQQHFERHVDIADLLPHNKRSYEVNESMRHFTFLGQEPVFKWYSSLPTNTEVCGVRFTDSRRHDYELRDFSSAEEATANGFLITHRYHCGTCSSLKNLAVYLAKPDLTTPARSCARRLTLEGIKDCLVETIGFEAQCAETWAYNVAHTKRQCMTTCIKHYGLWRVLTNDMGDSHVNDAGRLNPCLACDEYVSGPGFQYAAGRTRRASGLISAIERASAEIYPVDHSLYFK